MTRWLVLAAALVIQFLVLYLPGRAEPGIALFPGADKVAHLVIFLLPTLAVGKITRQWWPLGLLGLHAVVSEWLQLHYIPNRSGDVFDVLADVVGISIGQWWCSRKALGAADQEADGPQSA